MRLLPSLALCTILAACGGGGGDAESSVTLFDQTTTTTGGPTAGAAGQSVYQIQVNGPAVQFDRAATITVCAQGEWTQQLAADTQVYADIGLQSPLDSAAVGTLILSGARPSMAIPFSRCGVFETTGATTRDTAMGFYVRVGSGPSGSLAAYSVHVRWTATASY